ncbi:uncharacterized protein LOC111820085 [Trichechus manatus latirostris]|uniref:Uncharacterized protein LOC111820085 n=1 Tax=Trichechus manatus latirostris TaxID=127582 RepID=A0A2Y9QSY0_TRIMA|nr:uncharacterized protein LOC111820085 [Trichechus manatus latirostris]
MRACKQREPQQKHPGWCKNMQKLLGKRVKGLLHTHTQPWGSGQKPRKLNSECAKEPRLPTLKGYARQPFRWAAPRITACPKCGQAVGPAGRGGPRAAVPRWLTASSLRPDAGGSGSASSLSPLARPGQRGARRAGRAHGRLRDGCYLITSLPGWFSSAPGFPSVGGPPLQRPLGAARGGQLRRLTSLPSGRKISEITKTWACPTAKGT